MSRETKEKRETRRKGYAPAINNIHQEVTVSLQTFIRDTIRTHRIHGARYSTMGAEEDDGRDLAMLNRMEEMSVRRLQIRIVN